MNRRLLPQTAGSLAIVGVVLICWIIAGLAADQMARQELDSALRAQRQTTRSVVDNMAEVIASDLSMSRAIPATMAETRVVQQALTQAGHFAADDGSTEPARRTELLNHPALADINTFLHDAQGFSGLDAIWLVNTNGICVASSNARERVSYVGIDMHHRPWLKDTLLGAFAEMYGIGTASGEPGVFIAAPVYDDGLMAGAVVARVSISRLRHWVAHPGSFVSDHNGVIIMAHDNALEGLALPGARVEKMNALEHISVYLREHFTTIALQLTAPRARKEAPWMSSGEAGQLVELAGVSVPALFDERSGLNSGLSAHLIDPVTTWPELLAGHHRNRLLIFFLLSGGVAFVAVISVSWVRERHLHRATRNLAEQLKSANALLAAEARDDVLTGALSRRYFLDLLRHEIERAYATSSSLCMAIADLDYFKQINDRFGHAAGDLALRHFVDTCRAELRTDDAVGRLGGEEFGILLPSTGLATGLAVVERLRLQVKHRTIAELPPEFNLSVSIGITELASQDAPERLMSRADLALYSAKSLGRDRCEAIPPDDAVPPRTAETIW